MHGVPSTHRATRPARTTRTTRALLRAFVVTTAMVVLTPAASPVTASPPASPPASTQSASEPPPTTPAATAVQATASPSSRPISRPHSDRVRMPFPRDDGTLTPYTFDLGYQLMTLVYDTVMWRGADGVPRPWLADAVTVSPDGLTVTIAVAPHARWQDGPPVTSADIAFTFLYVAAHPHPRFTPELDAVTGVDTPDPATAVVRLSHPSQGFLEEPLCDLPILPQHLWAPLAPGAAAPPGLPVGSGPYRMVAHDAGKDYRFEAVADYFRGPPAVRAIDVPIIRDAAATVDALEHRDVDMLPVGLSADQSARFARDPGLRLERGSSYLGTVLMLDVRQPPFDRPEVRQAVAEALDLGRIADSVGGAVPAERGYLHPESGWAPPAAVHHLDPVAAREVLAHLEQTPVEVLAPDNDPAKEEAGRQVVLALGRAGLRANLRAVSPTALESALGVDGTTPAFQMAVWTSPPLASYDPDLLRRLFASGQPLDVSGYASTAFDAAAGRVVTAIDAASRRAAVVDALRLLAADAPVVPLYFPNGTFAVRPAVYDGWVYVKGTGILDKLSFVEPASPPSVTPIGTASPDGSGVGRLAPLTWAAICLVTLAVLLVAGRLVLWRLS